MRFFATRTPEIPIYCSKNGKTLKFKRVEEFLGILKLDSESQADEIACIEACIKQHIGGEIFVIDEAEYEKKTTNQPWQPRSRESIGGPNTASDTLNAPRLAPAPPAQASSEAKGPVAEADPKTQETPDKPQLRTRREGAKA